MADMIAAATKPTAAPIAPPSRPSAAPSATNWPRMRFRVTPSAIDVPISPVRSITPIIIVLEMLSTMMTAMMTRTISTCFENSATVLR